MQIILIVISYKLSINIVAIPSTCLKLLGSKKSIIFSFYDYSSVFTQIIKRV